MDYSLFIAFWYMARACGSSLCRVSVPPTLPRARSYHEFVDTNGVEDVISGRSAAPKRAPQSDKSPVVDSFKLHRDANGGCLVQVHRLLLLLLLLLLTPRPPRSWTAVSGLHSAACAKPMVSSLESPPLKLNLTSML